jgi:hypothetical protein
MRRGIVIVAAPHDSHIRLGFGVVSQADGIAGVHNCQVAVCHDETLDEMRCAAVVPRAEGHHGNDPSLDKLNAITLGQNAGIGHGMVLLPGEGARWDVGE